MDTQGDSELCAENPGAHSTVKIKLILLNKFLLGALNISNKIILKTSWIESGALF